MTAWLSILIPLLVMVFALGMERLETRLRSGTVREDEVEDFLERARPDEVKALFRQGIGGALQMFRLRNLGKRGGLGFPSAQSAFLTLTHGSGARRSDRLRWAGRVNLSVSAHDLPRSGDVLGARAARSWGRT